VLASSEGSDGPSPLYIYENTRVLPRYFLAGATRAFADSSRLRAALAQAPLEELRSTVFVDAAEGVEIGSESGVSQGGRVEQVAREADRIALSLDASTPSVLVCTMNYSPYWRAHVDGLEARVMAVDSTFLGVVVPEGVHELELRYEPPYAWLLPG
jgi:uncharacterized membrane protein YfhO